MLEIKKWEKLTNKITEKFIIEYFELEEDEEISIDWVSDTIGGIFEFADMFIGFDNVLDCYKHNISKEKFHNWYDYCINNEFVNISLAKFILDPEEKDKKEKEALEKSRLNLEFAKQAFNKAVKDY